MHRVGLCARRWAPHPQLLEAALQVELQRVRVGQVRAVALVAVPADVQQRQFRRAGSAAKR